MCGAALDIVVELDEGWADEIRARRFEIHNAAWLDAMSGGELTSDHRDGIGYSEGLTGDPYGYDVYGAGDLGQYGLLEDGGSTNLDFDASMYGAMRQ